MGRSWGAAKQPNGLARPHGDSQTQLAVLLKTIGLATSAANVCLTRAGGVYSFFINVSIPHSVISSWRAALAEYTLLWLPLSSHLNSPCSPAPSPAPWDSILPRYPPNQERGLLAGLWLNSEEGNLEGSVPAPFMALSHPSSLSLCVTSSETLSKTDLQGAGATKLDPPGYSGSGEDEAHRRTHIPLTGNERCRDGPGSATIPGRQMRERQQRCWGCERGEVRVPGWT